MLLPSSVGFMTVRAQAIEVLADSIDAGSEPDGRAIVATVEFVPSFVGALTIIPDNVIVIPTSITCTLSDDGKLIPPSDGEDNAGMAAADLFLIAPQQSSLSNRNWTWTATFRPVGTPKWAAFAIVFSGAPAEIVNLTTLASIPTDTGTTLQAWLLAVSDAEAARDAAAASAANSATSEGNAATSAAAALVSQNAAEAVPTTTDTIIAGQINAPASATRGALNATFAPISLAARMLAGTGFPEGVVVASIGTEYVDTLATNGAIKWVKAIGTGNTGWRVASGYTGWRILTSWTSAGVVSGAPLPSGMTPTLGEAGAIKIARQNGTVLFSISGATFSAQTIRENPSGFASEFPVAALYPTSSGYGKALINPSYIYVGGASQSTIPGYASLFSWSAGGNWPTTLPGTAA